MSNKSKKSSIFTRMKYSGELWICLWTGIVVLGLVTGFSSKSENTEKRAGKMENTSFSVEELKEMPVISVSNYMDSMRAEEEHGLVNYLSDNEPFYLEEALSAQVKAVVRPTGRCLSQAESLGQEFEILNVIEGEGLESGDIVVAYGSASIADRIGMLNYNGLLNLMNPSYTYQVFMNPSGLNPYQKHKEFYFESSLFPYVRVGENADNGKTLSSFSLADCQEAEFMTIKEENLEKLYEIKAKLVEQ